VEQKSEIGLTLGNFLQLQTRLSILS